MNRTLSRTLLSGTCLTLAGAGSAMAASFTETTDFSNLQGTPTVLPGGTDQVSGGLNWANDPIDVFTFAGVTAGDYTFSGTFVGDGLFFDVYLGPNALGSPAFSFANNFSTSLHLVETTDITVKAHFDWETTGYTVTLGNAASEAPEPSTLLLGAAGLAGALAWRRRRQA